MRMLLSSLLAAQLALAAGCADAPAPVAPDGPAGGSDAPAATPSISDGAHGGAVGFYFLPPLVEAPAFDATRSPTVEICTLTEAGCGDVIATFTMDTGPGSETVRVDTVAEHYVANWHTDAFDLVEGQLYRIRVSLEGREAGHADVVAVTSGKELKNAETGEQIALKDGRTLPVKFRIEEGLVLEFTVPALPPDSTPQEEIDDIYADSNLIDGDPFMTGQIPSDIVWVTFQFDATRQERQATVDQVNGEVVGGKFMNPGGIYYIRVPTDGTPDSLFQVIEELDSLPQVRWVGPDVNLGISPTYRRPDDGEGWDDWKLARGSADGANWALEDIAAPLAWGCSIGDSSHTVGIVDKEFHEVDDLAPHVASGSDLGSASDHHGTSVASIIGAVGDNGAGMTGTAWSARMLLIDYSQRTTTTGQPALRPYEALVDVIRTEAVSIINFSSGYYWQEQEGRLPQNTRADSNRVRAIGDVMYQAVSSFNFAPDGTVSPPPLFVISASNDGVDAWWSGSAQVADSADVRDHVLVVAATDDAGNLWDDGPGAASNRNIENNLVGIAAPGEDVAALDGSSTASVVRVTGTSFAAPYVAGLAALLKSFDPRLTASEIKTLILDGADRSDRAADGVPILNAHESLKAAAERTGAPLCGNRLWIDDGQIATQRGDGGPVEDLAPVDGEIGALMEALHGGKVLWYGTPSGDRVLEWEPEGETSSWTLVGVAGLPSNLSELRSGTDASMRGRSHGRDTLVLTDVSQTAGSLWWFEGTGPVEAPLARFTTSSSDEVASITVRDLPFEHEVVCIERVTGGACTSSVLATRTWFFRLSHPQHDRTIVETVNACFFSSLNLATEFGAGTFAPSVVGPETETTGALSTRDGTMYVPEVIGPVEIGMEEVP